MKMIRTQKNENWPNALEIEIVTVAGKKFGDPTKYAFSGNVDAKSLAPQGTYAALKNAVRAAEKLGWMEK